MKGFISTSALALLLAHGFPPVHAQEVLIPDPGLDAAIRSALHIPSGPLTEPDMLSLTSLDAGWRGVKNLAGLEAARNLTALDLQGNHLTSLVVPDELTNLITLDLSGNDLTSLTSLTLPADHTRLQKLYVYGNGLTNMILPDGLAGLTKLSLWGNRLSSLTLPAGLTNLTGLYLSENELTNVTLPAGLVSLTNLYLFSNPLMRLTLPADTTNLTTVLFDFAMLQSLVLPEPLAKGALADQVKFLLTFGSSVSVYPVVPKLNGPARTAAGIFTCLLTGPPGDYYIQATADFSTWTDLGPFVNETGSMLWTDPATASRTRRIYRAVRSN